MLRLVQLQVTGKRRWRDGRLCWLCMAQEWGNRNEQKMGNAREEMNKDGWRRRERGTEEIGREGGKGEKEKTIEECKRTQQLTHLLQESRHVRVHSVLQCSYITERQLGPWVEWVTTARVGAE